MTARPMTEKLEPCPFCESAATFSMPEYPLTADCEDAGVRCSRCDAVGPLILIDMESHGESDWPRLQAEAIAAWNRRSTSAAVRGMRKALEFYAEDKRYWGPNQNNPGNDPHTPADAPYLTDVTRDRGARALAALSGIEPGEDEQARGQGRSAPISTDTKGTTK